MKTEDFLTFFENSTRMVERALNEPYDFAVDYSAGDDAAQYVTTAIDLLSFCKRVKELYINIYAISFV